MPLTNTLKVFELKEYSGEKLTEIILGLKRKQSGRISGIEIKAITKIPGLYNIEMHDGGIIEKSGLIRIVQPQLWTRKYSWLLESELRTKSIPYLLADVGVENGKELIIGVSPYPSIEEIFEVHYKPRKRKY